MPVLRGSYQGPSAFGDPSWGPRLCPAAFSSTPGPGPGAQLDWRRLAAVDLEKVARDVDVSELQEHVSVVAYTELGSERCQHCGRPLDPAMLNFIGLAQLTVQYLLYSQEYLSASVEKLQGELARAREVESTVRQALSQKETDLHGVREEARRRKKLIATQQMLIQAGANHYHKCQHCDKAFVNYSYLQIHVTRRHPEVTNEERSRKMETQSLADQLAELKQELQATQTTLQAEREAQRELRAQVIREIRIRKLFEQDIVLKGRGSSYLGIIDSV